VRRLAVMGGHAVQPRQALAAALDQGGATGEEERHVAAEARGQRDPLLVAQLRGRAPCLERSALPQFARWRCTNDLCGAYQGRARRASDRCLPESAQLDAQ